MKAIKAAFRKLVPARVWTRRALTISVLIHVGIVGVSGFIIVLRSFHLRQAQFQSEPPPRPKLEPRKLEMKVKVQDLQKRSARPRLQPRLTSSAVTDLPLPEIKDTPKAVRQTLTTKISTFGVSGFGAGVGGGLGTAAGGGGTANVDFFGLQDTGQRIALIMDVSGSMCEDSRGGLKAYTVVKAKVQEVVKGLPDGTFFNVIVFQDGASVCWNKLVLANKETRENAIGWVADYWTVQNPHGLQNPNYTGGKYGVPAAGGTSRLDLALTAAFEQGASTIFLITDGIPVIKKQLEGEELKRWQDANAAARQPGFTAERVVTKAEYQEWERRKKAFEDRQKKGLGPQVTEGGIVGDPGPAPVVGDVIRYNTGGGPGVPWPMWGTGEILEHIEKLQKELYTDKGRRRAKVHCIGYATDAATQSFLKELARNNDGRFRKIKAFF